MKRLTLEEISKLAGVSRSTVSRVINNHPNIRPEVRSRVQQIIAETGYQPNMAARSLASNQSNIIGLVIPSVIQAVFTDPYYPRLTQGISQACNELGYTLSLFLFHTPEEEKDAIHRIAGNGLLDGLIVTADNIRDPFVPLLREKNIPFLQVGRPQNPEEVSYVDVDNVYGARIATEHLIELGYQRIGQISTVHNTAGIDRDRGYCEALKAHGRTVDDDLIVFGDFTEASGYQAMNDLLPQRPDAVFIQSDTMAFGAMRALRDAGLRVPEDIALIGFDDLPPAIRSDPPLSTIRQPIQYTGVKAVETLIDLMQATKPACRQVILPVELVIRASCGSTIRTHG